MSCPPCQAACHCLQHRRRWPVYKYHSRTALSPSSRHTFPVRLHSYRTLCKTRARGSWCIACRESAGAQVLPARISSRHTAGHLHKPCSTCKISGRRQTQTQDSSHSWGSSRRHCIPQRRGGGEKRSRRHNTRAHCRTAAHCTPESVAASHHTLPGTFRTPPRTPVLYLPPFLFSVNVNLPADKLYFLSAQTRTSLYKLRLLSYILPPP